MPGPWAHAKDMFAMGAQLMMTSFARANGGVVTPLASREDWEAHVGSQRQTEGSPWQQQVRGGSIPAHLTSLLPTPVDFAISGVGEAWRSQPWTDVPHLIRQSLIEEFPNFTRVVVPVQDERQEGESLSWRGG